MLPIPLPGPIITTVKFPDLEEMNELTRDLMPWMRPPDTNFTAPQMILPFFQRRLGETNAVEPSLIIPVFFVPPTASERSPSKAVYSTP